MFYFAPKLVWGLPFDTSRTMPFSSQHMPPKGQNTIGHNQIFMLLQLTYIQEKQILSKIFYFYLLVKEKSVQWFVFKQLALDFNLRFDICFWSFVLIVNAYNHCSDLNRICIKVGVRCFTSNLNTTCSVEVGLLSQTYILCSWK